LEPSIDRFLNWNRGIAIPGIELKTLAVAKRILRYLKGSKDLGVEYNGREEMTLKAYVDADWGVSENRRSVGGYIFILAGGAISWSCKKQDSVE
jgi:hypothetical protein